ncbi:hypothetical protein [Turicibacter sanguinis]|nr:hypothetical protein [Turicibacter sanguinis]MDB8553732.1 hypothetical protein [Turicibacter sanguinis]
MSSSDFDSLHDKLSDVVQLIHLLTQTDGSVEYFVSIHERCWMMTIYLVE